MKLFCRLGWQNEARGALSQGTANFSRAFEKVATGNHELSVTIINVTINSYSTKIS